MLTGAQLIAFVGTSDLERARKFYQSVLGLSLTEESGQALVFSCGKARLRLTLVDQVARVPYTSLGWVVQDLHVTARRLSASSVVFERFAGIEQDADGIWVAPGGDLVAWFKDLDGNLLSLTQSTQEGSSPSAKQ
jgi:catechol 2,3-dioxygenase-like lactoylglutathione lyase family enzyme